MPERLMTIEEIAEYFQVTKGAIYKRIQRGQLPYVKMGALLRFDPDKIQAYINANTIEPFKKG